MIPQRSQTPIVISSGPRSATRSKTSINTPGIKQYFLQSTRMTIIILRIKWKMKIASHYTFRTNGESSSRTKYVNTTVLPTEEHATNLKKLLLLEDRKEAIKQKAIGEEIDNLMAPTHTSRQSSYSSLLHLILQRQRSFSELSSSWRHICICKSRFRTICHVHL